MLKTRTKYGTENGLSEQFVQDLLKAIHQESIDKQNSVMNLKKMKYKLLPNTQIEVSCICLGTMTFGRQNTENDGHQQLDYAFDHGVNFIDTAEMYPVPAEATRYGNTERIIGSWIKKSGKRKNIVLATKIAGPGDYTKHIRTTGFSEKSINEAVDNSLSRLQTDYIDLYQLLAR